MKTQAALRAAFRQFTLFYEKPAENYFLDNKSRYANKLRAYPFLSILYGMLLQSIYNNQAIYAFAI